MIYEIQVTDSREKPVSANVILTTTWLAWGRWKARGAHTFSVSGGGHDEALWNFNPTLHRITLKEDGREILYLDNVRQRGAHILIELDDEGAGWMLQPNMALRDYYVEWKCVNAIAG